MPGALKLFGEPGFSLLDPSHKALNYIYSSYDNVASEHFLCIHTVHFPLFGVRVKDDIADPTLQRQLVLLTNSLCTHILNLC